MARTKKDKKETVKIEVDTDILPEVRTVVWEDHNSVDNWCNKDEYVPEATMVVSCGFVVYEDDKMVSIANSYSVDDGFCCIINILKNCIISND